MRETSDLYKQILSSGRYWTETRLIIGNGTDPEQGYDESVLCSMTVYSDVFSEDAPVVGCCIASEIDIVMHKPNADIAPNARLVPYVRITDGTRRSEWLQKGVFRIDTRDKVEDGTKIEKITFKGYDDMLKTEQDYEETALNWPAKDMDVVAEIAAAIGVQIDPRTTAQLMGYWVQYPAGYSYREVLGYIAAAYAGSFIMSDLGMLRLVTLNGIPKETRYLITETGSVITFGGDRILV